MTSILFAFLVCQTVQAEEQGDVIVSIASVNALLVGHYDNSAQVAQGKVTEGNHPPQHVTFTIQPTPKKDWQLWRVHMDVSPAVARAAGSATSLDAVWAMNISRKTDDKSLQIIPYTLKPSVNAATVSASAFDQAQWFPLEACMLVGDFGHSSVVAQAPADEMCVAETMGLGGKRAFLPSWIKREGDWLHIQLIYFGYPWRVDARRDQIGERKPNQNH